MSSLLSTSQTEMDVEAFLASLADASVMEIHKESADTRAWFVTAGGQAYFCKWVETARYETLLAKDTAICSQQLHVCIPRLLNTIRTADGVLLAFERVQGEALTTAEARARFFALPVVEKMRALRQLFAALCAIVEVEWIIVDFYDGNVIYDYEAQAVYVFDFELFEAGEGFTLQLDRNYGSRRLMAPEEFVRGAWLDQRTNVFTLGRYALCALSARTDEQWRIGFQGGDPLAEVLEHATQNEPTLRYATVRAFVEAFEHACSQQEGEYMPSDTLESIPDFLGLSDRIGTAGQPSAEQFASIREAGYEVVINLRPPADALPNERALVEGEGMEYVSIPVVWEAPTIENAEQFFAAMQANEGRRVFVHCARNMRVSAFMYLYRVVKQQVAPEVAVRDLHRIWEPNPTWQQLIEQVTKQIGTALITPLLVTRA